ncbi:TPR-like protein [Metschnikowia bicuspidata var. bicuspidata NRRL YB-4993]|uniref:TPR-like protein n=1 Tax=Metschnikowia bicuspidata var. bicuspidata NRRL YB-4993 TaxID=869754 RepID=A0A1A0H501_9ASCO|nr:TPR-like protein [Metschnikowia bicuspidata var. bicuspidata NRRL YB-4993]OBA18987.1 TPR-like protein [Metschnikowia bicuspidata var. bicuspidata NRRL YB-4993]
MSEFRRALVELLLLLPAEKAAYVNEVSSQSGLELEPTILTILHGNYDHLLAKEKFGAVLEGTEAIQITSQYPHKSLRVVLDELAHLLIERLPSISCQLIAITFLQLFVQCNFTGPQSDVSAKTMWFPNVEDSALQADAVNMLSIEGKCAYDLMHEPTLLAFSLVLLENLQHVQHSLIQLDHTVSIEDVTADTLYTIEKLAILHSPENASLSWWRARALQVHLSVLSEPSDILASVTSSLLNADLVEALSSAEDPELSRHVHLVYLLESARNGIHAQTEHLAEPFLHKAADVAQLQFVLTGAKAKRTKFQTFHTASLVLLAKSKDAGIYTTSEAQHTPESFDLNSDLLLEKPQYESLGDVAPEEEPNTKKLRLDNVSHFTQEGKRLLPISMTPDGIPADLRELDPNNQPSLSDLDNVQLLLRLTTIRQTTPVGNSMVEEELSAIVNRIVFSTPKTTNWTVFGRTLWERSSLETNKARTVERGILQMTSLVEEVGVNIKSRMIPQAQDSKEAESSAVSSRLRFIHQLPLMAQWTMDSKLAEKYMSLGVLKSAIEIYERLNLMTEAALCYAAVDDEVQAEKLLKERIRTHPEDSRAISILGDIRQDPALWEKAWDIGKYAKAKASLSRFYYKPPTHTGLQRDLETSISHMQDCLSASPLSYENWFFYGCCGLEGQNFELASEAFTRCVSLDDTQTHAWSNLASALLRLDKTRQAFTALKRALQQGEGSKRSWRIFENYLTVAAKLGEWNEVLHATKELIEIGKESGSEVKVDITVIETLVQILVEEPYPTEGRLTHFQSSCINLVCEVLPTVINHSARLWRIVSKVELWRGKPWTALESFEKAYRATSLRPELTTDEAMWNEAVESCSDLISAYESFGDLPGKHDAGDVVCKDWKYKARSSIRSLMSKGKLMWEDSEGWERLIALKEDLAQV